LRATGKGFDNTYARLPAGFFVDCAPAPVPDARLVFFDHALASELGLAAMLEDPAAPVQVFSGQRVPTGARPIAQVYAGHQFGHFSPRLGDGRALLLGEVLDTSGRRVDIAFKGSGRTPYSRGGDGKAALGPMLREVLMSASMHALGVPTTRALAVVTTGEPVLRDRVLPGAILTRVAASHLRVGTFEYFAARGDLEAVDQLLDYAIERHDPALRSEPQRAHAWFEAVARRQASLLAHWMNVGFIHGVMNTDNMTISGETIDYGPCAFLEAYDPSAVYSSIDQHGRYSYGNQPRIARWNLARLAETILHRLGADPQAALDRASEVLTAFPRWYEEALWAGQRAKLGLRVGEPTDSAAPEDEPLERELVASCLTLLQQEQLDYTSAWRSLADELEAPARGQSTLLSGLASTLSSTLSEHSALHAWLERWRAHCLALDRRAGFESASALEDAARRRAVALRAVNPRIIARNYRVEEALAAATDEGDFAPFEALLAAVRQPYAESDVLRRFAEPAPAGFDARYQTFCGT